MSSRATGLVHWAVGSQSSLTHLLSGRPPRRQRTRHFVSSYSSTKLVDRSVFLSCLNIQNGLNNYTYLSHLYGKLTINSKTRKNIMEFTQLVINTTKQFLEIVAKLRMETSKYHALKFPGQKYVRRMVYSKNGDFTTNNPLGGVDVQTSNINRYVQWKNSKSTLGELNLDGTSLFPNFDTRQMLSYIRCKNNYNSSRLSTFDNPLGFYLSMVEKIIGDQGHPTCSILRLIILSVSKVTSECVDGSFNYVDDIVRQMLSVLDKRSFLLCQSSPELSMVFTNLHGLSTLGGPRGWSEDSISRSIHDWIDVRPTKDCLAIPHVRNKFESWMRQWSAGDKPHLRFSQFCRDPMRWATGGGSSSSEILGERYRTKWAWAMSNALNGVDAYERAKLEENTAHVALKEEVKTRTVITTPMASYLRQSYLWYRLGRPKFLSSTISNPGLVKQLINTDCKNFVCIDASQFDHCISKEFIINFFNSIKNNHLDDDDIVRCCDDEIESLLTLKLEYGKTTFDYENGLLSGWRFTSLIGSLYSALVCEHINHALDRSFPYITQGDDIIILSKLHVDKENIIRACDEFGLTTNPSKTTLGQFGEFLKYRYGSGVVQGYAARAVRSIFYANPWLDTKIVVKPDEVTSKWFTVMSRISVSSNILLTPSAWNQIKRDITSDVFGWTGHRLKKKDILLALETPVSVGGLGVWETCNFKNTSISTGWVSLKTIVTVADDGNHKFLSSFGIQSQRSNVLTRTYERAIRTSSAKQADKYVKNIYHGLRPEVLKVEFFDDVNIFQSIIEKVSSCKSTPPILNRLRANANADDKIQTLDKCTPRHLRKANRWHEILQWLMAGEEHPTYPPSLYVDNRYDQSSKYLDTIANVIAYNVKNITANLIFYMQLCCLNAFYYQKAIIHAM
ncbi:RNA-dependent RNA polymerase [Bactrocera dorsalis toti-like virus 2]|uniref:RNA-directed RNA polymerase n=1 Tax=Bactrocera dorsalis toti-like virus 2 TaxID=2760898 RepID=A0A7G4YW94_9VIRU|nr:RNA-dependent RNA polymerase [Bactrocera dorsalis toti-like virus 2]